MSKPRSRAAAAATCAFCATTLVGYRLKHAEADCPLRACLTCNACGEDGHSSDMCTQGPPEYCYKNTVAKSLKAFLAARRNADADAEADSQEAAAAAAPKRPIIKLLEDEKVFREFVRARVVFGPGEGPAMKIEENKRKIKKWAKEAGVKVVFKEKAPVRPSASVCCKDCTSRCVAVSCPASYSEDIFAKYDRIYEEYNPRPKTTGTPPSNNPKKL
jgi:hypothetical protein